ncbi:hypothetical protein ACROYT_G002012 [Oculina patagonica]
MFRFLFAKRGKGNISLPVETQQRNAQLATENIDMPATKTFQVLRPVLLVSAALTGYTHQRYRVQGIIGGFLWLSMLLAHGALDFLAARQVYTYGWASVSISLFLLCFVCTVFSNRKMLPWLEKGMSVLEEEKRYPKTLERSAKVFKWIPLFTVMFGLICGSGIYVCLHFDNTLDVKIDLSRDKTEFPDYALVILKVVRFLSGCYVMASLALFWSISVCVMHITGYSMIEFHDEITSHLINKDSPITFRQGVVSFSERGKFVKKSASACRVTLAVLLVYSIASLAVNAFLFLYKERHIVFAIYALLPSIAAIYPLCMAAWVTKQYSWYLAVVVKAWAERPESSSEDEAKDPERSRKNEKHTNQKRGRSLWRRVHSAKKSYREKNLAPLKKTNSNPLASQSDSEAKSGVEEVSAKPSNAGDSRLRAPVTVSDPEFSDDEKHRGHEPDNDMSEDDKLSVKEADKNHSGKETPKRSRREVMDIVLRGAARAVGKLKHNAKKPRFNFEKYISYLQNVLPNIGFDIMGIIVTWNMVSAIIFLEVSVLALFVQESIFGNTKATVAL